MLLNEHILHKCGLCADINDFPNICEVIYRQDHVPTVFLGAGVDLFTANAISCSGEGQDLDAVVCVFL